METIYPADLMLFDAANGQGDQNSFVNKMIKRVGQPPHGQKVAYSHVGVSVSPISAFDDMSIVGEMTWDRLRLANIFKYYLGSKIMIFRHSGLSMDSRQNIAGHFRKNVGKKYGWRKIIAHAADYPIVFALSHLLNRPVNARVFSSLLGSENSVCSGEVARAYNSVGSTTFNMRAHTVQPNDIHRYCEKTEYMELIYDGFVG